VVHYTTLMSCLQKAGQVGRLSATCLCLCTCACVSVLCLSSSMRSKVSACKTLLFLLALLFLYTHTHHSPVPLPAQWEQSMRVYRQMEAASILPDVVAHNAAITACAQVCGSCCPASC
jgi:hypothetical protein